jgi:hypothetical protein
MRPTRRILPALVLSATLTATLTAASGTTHALAKPGISTSSRVLAPGLTLKTIYDPSVPNHIYVLVIKPTKSLSLDSVLAGAMGVYAPTSQIASGHGAFAAINGDFTVRPGHPMHSFGMGGDLTQLGLAGTTFGFSSDLRHNYILNQRPSVAFENLATKAKLSISNYNSGDPSNGSIVAYTSYGVSGGIQPPSNSCSARLTSPTRIHWASRAQVGVYRDWKVGAVVCQATPMAVPTGSIVLSAGTAGAGARAIRKLKNHGKVRVSWSLGHPGVDQAVGGMPQLVTNGVDTAPPAGCRSYFCSQNSRTAVGITATGKVLLVVVDGKQRGWSEGLTLRDLGKEMISLGAKNAVDLDGSGGSTMWIKGQGVINRPSDSGGERPITSALLVMKGSAGQLAPLPFVKVK